MVWKALHNTRTVDPTCSGRLFLWRSPPDLLTRACRTHAGCPNGSAKSPIKAFLLPWQEFRGQYCFIAVRLCPLATRCLARSTRPRTRERRRFALPVDSSGGSGSSAGGNGRNGNSNDTSEDDDGSWFDEWSGAALVLAAFLALGIGTYYLAFRNKKPEPQPEAVALLRENLQRLKRLQKETFAELVNIRSRLDKVETANGPGAGDAAQQSSIPDALLVSPTTAKMKVQAVLQAGTTLCFSQAAAVAKLLLSSGCPAGSRFLLGLSSRDEEGVHTLNLVGSSQLHDANLRLTKVMYRNDMMPGVTLHICPMGCRGSDVAATLNPCDGWGLGDNVRHGSSPHRHMEGTGVAITTTGQDYKCTAAHFQNGPIHSSLLQVTSLGSSLFSWALLTAYHSYNQFQLPFQLPQLLLNHSTSHPAHPSHMDVYHTNSANSPPRSPPRGRETTPKGEGLAGPSHASHASPAGQSAQPMGDVGDPDAGHGDFIGGELHGAAVGVLNIEDEFALSGWVDPLGLHPGGWGWGLTLSAFPDVDGNCWALSAGQNRLALFDEPRDRPFVLEMSARYCVGDGMYLTPGALFVQDKDDGALAFALKSEWMF